MIATFRAIVLALVTVGIVVYPKVPALASDDDCITLEARSDVAKIAWDDFIQYEAEGNEDLAKPSREEFDHEMHVGLDYSIKCDAHRPVAKYFALDLGRTIYDINTMATPFNKDALDAADVLLQLLTTNAYYKIDPVDFYTMQSIVESYFRCAKKPFKEHRKAPDMYRLTGDACQVAGGTLTYSNAP